MIAGALLRQLTGGGRAVPSYGEIDQLVFILDGGTLSATQVETISICDPEVSEFAFVELAEAKAMLRPDMAQRLARAHDALTTGATDYSE